MTEVQRLVKIKLLKELLQEYELMAKYNTNSHDYDLYSALDWAVEVLEQEPCEEYKRGWHDAIVTALEETHNYYTEDGVFRAIQEESLIGVGMLQ